MGVNLVLRGEGTIHSIPPYRAQVASFIPVLSKVYDNGPNDENTELCNILSDWSYTEHYTKVSLEIPLTGGLVRVPVVDTKVKGAPRCEASPGCDEWESKPTILLCPDEVTVPIPREKEKSTKVSFVVEGAVSSSKSEEASTMPSLNLDVSPLTYGKVDKSEKNGKWVVSVSANHAVENGTTEPLVVTVTVKDSDNPTLYDTRKVTIRYVADHRPHAISGGTEIHCPGNGGCFAPVTFAAADPDLPKGNFGYNLYFVPDFSSFPREWDCSSSLSPYLSSFGEGEHFMSRCAKEEGKCELTFACNYTNCDWPRYPIQPGTYEFPFWVVEYNPLRNKYAFADSGVWTVKVTAGQPPIIDLPSSEIVVSPGKRATSTVTATDPEGGWLTLTKVWGPGKFSEKKGAGKAGGSWSWKVSEPYWGSPWRLVWFKATDTCGGLERCVQSSG